MMMTMMMLMMMMLVMMMMMMMMMIAFTIRKKCDNFISKATPKHPLGWMLVTLGARQRQVHDEVGAVA